MPERQRPPSSSFGGSGSSGMNPRCKPSTDSSCISLSLDSNDASFDVLRGRCLHDSESLLGSPHYVVGAPADQMRVSFHFGKLAWLSQSLFQYGRQNILAALGAEFSCLIH